MVRTGLTVALLGVLVSAGLVAGPASGAGRQGASPRSILIGANGVEEPLILGAGIKPPELIDRVAPEYPAEERSAGVRGKVVLEAVIDERGTVTGVKVLRGLKAHPSFSEAAVKAVRKWTFRPATKQGVPVKVYFTVVVAFSPTNTPIPEA